MLLSRRDKGDDVEVDGKPSAGIESLLITLAAKMSVPPMLADLL